MLVQEIYHNGELLGVEITCNGDALHVAYSRPWEGLRLGTFPRMFDNGEPVTYERKTVYSYDLPHLENYQGRMNKRKSRIEWPEPFGADVSQDIDWNDYRDPVKWKTD